LNPSIKGYVGSVIVDDLETYSDIFESAIRFKQIATLWRLRREVESTSKQLPPQHRTDAFISRLTELADSPSYSWTTSPDGETIGHRIDYGTEERLRFFAEFCDVEHAAPGLDRIYDAMERMISIWSPQVVSLWHTPELVREMVTLDRFIAGRGANIRQLVLEKMLDALPHARSIHWRNLIDLPESTPGWQQRNRQKFFEGLRSYMNGGWREDFDYCEDSYDRERLIENLSELTQRKQRSRFFVAPLREVQGNVSAIADQSEKPDLGTGSLSQILPRSSLSESEVRSMFQTLLLDGS
jgi:hypothetical protein